MQICPIVHRRTVKFLLGYVARSQRHRVKSVYKPKYIASCIIYAFNISIGCSSFNKFTVHLPGNRNPSKATYSTHTALWSSLLYCRYFIDFSFKVWLKVDICHMLFLFIFLLALNFIYLFLLFYYCLKKVWKAFY